MRVVDLIDKKQRKEDLTKEEINFLIKGYTSGEIPDYQMSAFIMAVYFNGLNYDEIAVLTKEMMLSGDTFNLEDISGIKVDKHSTGGVGDKTTIALAPIVASFGVVMSKMSGRGLGHTGGTLDKLESIPGFRINYQQEEFRELLKKHNIALIGQTGNIVPADKKLYALRDATNTVMQKGLIASSIMSKKLATGSNTILLDVKVGNGAFMKTIEDASELSKIMIEIGKKLNRDVKAMITNMNLPLGKAVGNKIEILEAIETLKGNAPRDFHELIIEAASTILVQAKKFDSKEIAKKEVENKIKSGEALQKFNEWIEAQEGDLSKMIHNPKYTKKVLATEDGYMKIKSAVGIGIVSMKLGAGRERKEDEIDYDAGIYIEKQNSDIVKNGDVLFTLYSGKEITESLINELKETYEITNEKNESKIIIKIIE
ncbi:MAG: thymidine phosphorylase [Mycoplasma sp.]|nr:thymidine phosphorylase [Mycoplasma sp.]